MTDDADRTVDLTSEAEPFDSPDDQFVTEWAMPDSAELAELAER